MARDFYYQRNPDKALGGMMGLSLEERGAYNTILDLIYARRDRLRDDDEDLKKWMACDVRVWRRIKQRLVDLGKITIEDGFIRNSAATEQINSRTTGSRTQGYAQNNPQGALELPVPTKSGGTSAELTPLSVAEVRRTYTPTSTAHLNKPSMLGDSLTRGRDSIVDKYNPLTPFAPDRPPPDLDLRNYDNLILLASWLLATQQVPPSEQNILCSWIEKGFNLNGLRHDIENRRAKHMDKNAGKPPRSLAYYTQMLEEKHRAASGRSP